MKILFITKKENRVYELKEILEKFLDVANVDSLFDLDFEYDLSLCERDLTKRALEKVEKIWNDKKDEYDYIMCEEFGLYTEYAPNILGVDHKRWWPGTDRDRNEALIKLFEGIKDRKIYYKSSFIAKSSDGFIFTSTGFTRGFLGRKVKEKNGIGYDSVFAIEGKKHLSQYSQDEIKEFYASNKSLEELAKKISHHKIDMKKEG